MNSNRIRVKILPLLLIIPLIMSGCGVGVVTHSEASASTSTTLVSSLSETEASVSETQAEVATTAKTEKPSSSTAVATTTAASTTTTKPTTKKSTTTTTTTATTKKTTTSTTKKPTELKDGKCTITIQCKAILDNMDKLAEGHEEYAPENGIILGKTEYKFKGGDSVYTVLKAVCDKKGIKLNIRSTMYGKYIAGINELDEFDAGHESGWKYKVNGKDAPVACSSYKLKDGDKIEFYYTLSV